MVLPVARAACGRAFDPEQGRGLPLGGDVRFGRNDLLIRGVDGKLLQQGTAQMSQRIKLPVYASSKPRFENRAASADRRDGVTRNAGDVVKDRPEAALGYIHLLSFPRCTAT